MGLHLEGIGSTVFSLFSCVRPGTESAPLGLLAQRDRSDCDESLHLSSHPGPLEEETQYIRLLHGPSHVSFALVPIRHPRFSACSSSAQNINCYEKHSHVYPFFPFSQFIYITRTAFFSLSLSSHHLSITPSQLDSP